MPSEFPEGCPKLTTVVSYNNDLKSNKMPGKTSQQMNNEEVRVSQGEDLCPLLSSPLPVAFQCNYD